MKGKTLNQITNTPKAGLKELSSLPDNEEFNVEITSKESGKKYLIDSSELSNGNTGSGGQTLSIDRQDLSISGGNTVTLPNSLFPNGLNIISADYEIQASDEGKLIVSFTGDVSEVINITMPTGIIFTGDKALGITMVNAGTFQIDQTHGNINPLHQIDDGLGIGEHQAETIFFTTLSDDGDGNSMLIPMSTSVINDAGTIKTMLRYLYDKSDVGFRGTATLVGGTVTVANANVKTGNKIYASLETPSGTAGVPYASTADIIDSTSFVINSTSVLDNSTVNWWIAP
jgi:hypothetical protein